MITTLARLRLGVTDTFSARWKGVFEFPDAGRRTGSYPGNTESYQFSVRSDDGSKLW